LIGQNFVLDRGLMYSTALVKRQTRKLN